MLFNFFTNFIFICIYYLYNICSAAQHICTPSRAACQPTVHVSSFEHSIGPRTHHKVAILAALFAHMV